MNSKLTSKSSILSKLGIIQCKKCYVGYGNYIITDSKIVWYNPLTYIYLIGCIAYLIFNYRKVIYGKQ